MLLETGFGKSYACSRFSAGSGTALIDCPAATGFEITIVWEVFVLKDKNCGYCMKNELLDGFGIYVQDLPASVLVLFKEQSHPGRCIVASKEHVSEISDMTEEEAAAFIKDVRHVAKAVHKAFNPDKVNYGAYGDTAGHCHVHIVPKYKDGFEWGGIFQMNPEKKFLTDDEYKEVIAKLKAAL